MINRAFENIKEKSYSMRMKRRGRTEEVKILYQMYSDRPCVVLVTYCACVNLCYTRFPSQSVLYLLIAKLGEQVAVVAIIASDHLNNMIKSGKMALFSRKI